MTDPYSTKGGGGEGGEYSEITAQKVIHTSNSDVTFLPDRFMIFLEAQASYGMELVNVAQHHKRVATEDKQSAANLA